MASPNSTFTEIVSTTLRKHSKEIKDNVSNHNALLSRLNSKGRISVAGGYEIVEPLDYAENATFQRYSGYDVLNITPSDVISAAKFDWKQAAVHVVASGKELRMNSGKEAIINLAKSRMTNAIRTFKNNISADVYSDGTASNQINGLQALVADAGTGTVGGIVSGTHTWWKNVVQSAAAPLQGGSTVTMSSTTIEVQMNNLWYELTRGQDKPDMIVMSNDYFAMFEESQMTLRRYTNEQSANAGFTTLKYKGADVFHDGGTKGGGITAAHAYFLNTDFLKFVSHPDADMTQLPDKSSVNQDAVVMPIIWMGNLTVSNRSLQGVMKS